MARVHGNQSRYVVGILAVAALVSMGHSQATELMSPKIGIVFNTSETHSLTYDCKPVTSTKLECLFVQASVKKKGSSGSAAKVLSGFLKDHHDGKLVDADGCKLMRSVVDLLSGKVPLPKNRELLDKMPKVERADMLASARVFTEYCSNPSEALARKMAALKIDEDNRTCEVSARSFSATFAAYPGAGDTITWIEQSTPQGECGIVNMSRFESEVSVLGLPVWKFFSRKAITNPSAKTGPAQLSCSGWDEREYSWDWRDQDGYKGCDYIKLSF